LTEDLVRNSLLIKGGESNVMSFGDGVECFEIVSIFMGIEALDQRIENSVSDAEGFYTSIYSGLAG